MAESFTLDVLYKNIPRQFDAELRVTGYTYRIMVSVNDQEIIFEPDEERNYRAVLPDNAKKQNVPDVELLKAIASGLEAALK